MYDLHEPSDQAQKASRPDEPGNPGNTGQDSGALPGPSSVLFWFVTSGAVWIALVASVVWLV